MFFLTDYNFVNTAHIVRQNWAVKIFELCFVINIEADMLWQNLCGILVASWEQATASMFRMCLVQAVRRWRPLYLHFLSFDAPCYSTDRQTNYINICIKYCCNQFNFYYIRSYLNRSILLFYSDWCYYMFWC